METIPNRFSLIIAGLRDVIAAAAARDSARVPLFVQVWTRVGRAAIRFERLFARWRAGKLTTPRTRPSRAGQPSKPRQSPPLPSARAWLVVLAIKTAAAGSQLRHLISQPDMEEFLAACPQAGRILRPLCHMLGNDMPPVLLLPTRTRKRRARPPADPAKPRPSRRHLPLWEAAPLRNFVRR